MAWCTPEWPFTQSFLHPQGNSSSARSARSIFYQSGLQVSQQVTPHLHLSISRVCDRLKIPVDCIEAFVYASPDLQAECYSGGLAECTLRFTSSLVDLLENDEMDFVIGHELGHFLLRHSISRMENESEDLEYYVQHRFQEVSADRLGLIACGSLDVAIRTLLKTISGLGSQHLRLDTGTFIAQLQKSKYQSHFSSTHPSILIRSRALLWFSMGGNPYEELSDGRVRELQVLDDKIIQDFDKYVDRAAKEKLLEIKDNLYLWMAAYKVVEDGCFDKNEQKKFIGIFGEETFSKFINFASDMSGKELLNSIMDKISSSRVDLEKMNPSGFMGEVKKIDKKVKLNF